jgi:choline kinase
MRSPLAVVVNAAGLGTRLGSERPKALTEVAGRSLLHWQLAMLRHVRDVRVVVGYQADLVERAVLDIRPGALIRYNPEYASTGTAASLMLGASGIDGPVLSLDCDLVVHPEDLQAFLRRPAPVLGVLPVQSLEPVTVRMAEGSEGMLAERFDRAPLPGWMEWSGLVTFDPRDPALGPRQGHVFELIAPLLPIPAAVIRAVELDFPEELPAMEAWISALRAEGHLAWI